MPDRATIELIVTLCGVQAESETTYTWAGAYVLSVHTTLPRPDLAIELHSTFVGHVGVDTHVVHLLLGPPGRDPLMVATEHDHEQLDPMLRPRSCVYEHAHQLIEILKELGLDTAVDIPGDDAFAGLERALRDR